MIRPASNHHQCIFNGNALNEAGLGARFLRRHSGDRLAMANMFDILSINDLDIRGMETATGCGGSSGTPFGENYNSSWHMTVQCKQGHSKRHFLGSLERGTDSLIDRGRRERLRYSDLFRIPDDVSFLKKREENGWALEHIRCQVGYSYVRHRTTFRL
jgi:hypothetical protein